MRIINDNVLHNGTYTASNESLNYPVSNLDHPFLSKRFQATASASTVVCVLESASTIDAIGHAYTNATSGTIVIYSGGPTTYTTVETITMDLTYDPCLTYTTSAASSITKIEFILSTDDSFLYLGGVSAGEYYEIDNAYADFSRNQIDNTTWEQTRSGQSLSNYRKPLRNIGLRFKPPLANSNGLVDVYRALGIGYPFFIDFFYNQRDIMPPLYACFSSALEDAGNGRYRILSTSFQECK